MISKSFSKSVDHFFLKGGQNNFWIKIPIFTHFFQEKMTKFVEEATTNLKDLNDLIKDCSSKFIITMKFFRFKPKDGRLEMAQPKDFFCTWQLFCHDYKNFWKKEQLKIEKELLKEERMKIKLKTGNLKDFKVEPIKPNGLKEKYCLFL